MPVVPEVVLGDITVLPVDAIVNAADPTLLGGGGVDGAIHRAAGPGLLDECRAFEGCAPGDARITGGHGLRARYVIHAVGPVWGGGARGEADLLRACYRRSLALADAHAVRSIAFPCIATGVYRFPVEAAARLSLRTVRDAAGPSLERVLFCCFSQRSLDAYALAYGEAGLPFGPVVPAAGWT